MARGAPKFANPWHTIGYNAQWTTVSVGPCTGTDGNIWARPSHPTCVPRPECGTQWDSPDDVSTWWPWWFTQWNHWWLCGCSWWYSGPGRRWSWDCDCDSGWTHWHGCCRRSTRRGSSSTREWGNLSWWSWYDGLLAVLPFRVDSVVFSFVCVCVCVCVYACIHACMYVCMCVYMHVCVYACMYVCMYVCMFVCMYVCLYVCMYVCMCVCGLFHLPSVAVHCDLTARIYGKRNVIHLLQVVPPLPLSHRPTHWTTS